MALSCNSDTHDASNGHSTSDNDTTTTTTTTSATTTTTTAAAATTTTTTTTTYTKSFGIVLVVRGRLRHGGATKTPGRSWECWRLRNRSPTPASDHDPMRTSESTELQMLQAPRRPAVATTDALITGRFAVCGRITEA